VWVPESAQNRGPTASALCPLDGCGKFLHKVRGIYAVLGKVRVAGVGDSVGSSNTSLSWSGAVICGAGLVPKDLDK
jgi:hypothetical protein